MQIKINLKSIVQVFSGIVIGFVLCIGVLTVLANYPEAPNDKSEGGWLGSVFDLKHSGTGKLIVNSVNMTLPKNVEITENEQLTTKKYVDDYVDQKVKAMSSGGGSTPTMISEKFVNNKMTNYAALRYCASLEEDGYTDWRLPEIEELVDLVEKFNIKENDYLWSRSVIGGPTDEYYSLVLSPTGYWKTHYSYNYDYYATRCVR